MGQSLDSLLYKPTDEIAGYKVRPGKYLRNGSTVVDGGGINFTIHSFGASSCTLCLFYNGEKTPFVEIPIPDKYRIGNTYSIVVFGLDYTEIEYAYKFDGESIPEKGILYDKNNYLLDPYAKAVTGKRVWGEKIEGDNRFYKARVVKDNYDWKNFEQPNYQINDLIIYELHVRGYTMAESSDVTCRGTFEGIWEKIPYLKELGINAVELMPIFQFDETEDVRIVDGEKLYNYWGYSPVCFFAPNSSYSAQEELNREGHEFRTLVHELNKNGIEVILDVVFNHTAEGNELGPCFSFKGIDNNIYYMLTPDGKYYNFSGCGNVMNCNHPIVQQFILDCLRYWVVTYRVDGFRFDLAAIMGRNEDGSPMSKPPLLQSLAFDPILGRVKLIAEAWDAGGLYQVGNFPAWNRWAEWNGRYRDDMRCFLKGDYGMARAAVNRLTGSLDLYGGNNRGENASVNFIDCHDGFTLYDLYAYNDKHNEKNGWNNSDGDNNNNSWNCGVEGETDNQEVLALRNRLRKNAFASLMCSRGSVMFLAGDEFCNTQYGNNNAYCQDNMISWLDWTRKDEYSEMFEFCKYMIAFRKAHPILHRTTNTSGCGFPEVSVHNNTKAWNSEYNGDTRVIGVMFSGRDENNEKDDVIYVGINAFWEDQDIELPVLPLGHKWRIVVNTELEHKDENYYNEKTRWQGDNNHIRICARSVLVARVVDKDFG